MPHLIVKLVEGRNEAIKRELAARLVTAVTQVLGLDTDAVSIAMEDVPASDWMTKVSGPDIESAAKQLVKNPGYGPLAVQRQVKPD